MNDNNDEGAFTDDDEATVLGRMETVDDEAVDEEVAGVIEQVLEPEHLGHLAMKELFLLLHNTLFF